MSFGLGMVLGGNVSCRFLAWLGLHRACAFVSEMKSKDRADRLAALEQGLPGWIGRRLVRHRYILIAVALNLPGNTLLGGGGGIMLLAGLSRLFSPVYMILTLIVAVAPVPLGVALFGPGILE